MGSQALKMNRIYARGDMYDKGAAGFSTLIRIFDLLLIRMII